MLKVDLVGKKFSRLLVVNYAGRAMDRHSLWECICDCGNVKIVSGNQLKQGGVTSCGCYASEIIGKNNSLYKTKHGMSTTRSYNTWAQMRGRCENKNNDDYENYGGRGITVCERWKVFENFWEDMKDGYSAKLTLDRKDNNGNYTKENCRWATVKEQLNNTRVNHMITFNGLTLTLSQFAEKYKISKEALWYRLKNGWEVEKSLLTPVRPSKAK